MLKNRKGRNPKIVTLDEEMWLDLVEEILVAIRKKIAILKNMIHLNLDENICAGLYTFILEEFGKLILLTGSDRISNNKRQVKYANEFTDHVEKFAAALDYLEKNGFEEAYVLNNQGDFDPKSFSWRGFIIGQLVDIETRLSLFYVDLERNAAGDIVVGKTPFIDKGFLETAINKFEKAVTAYNIPH